jgi:hypothetical protein
MSPYFDFLHFHFFLDFIFVFFMLIILVPDDINIIIFLYI